MISPSGRPAVVKGTQDRHCRLQSIPQSPISSPLGCDARLLSLPPYQARSEAQGTSADRIVQLGIHNTLEVIAEAQERSQIARLSSTVIGRHRIKKLGSTEQSYDGHSVEIPSRIEDLITATQIPRNVHPEHTLPRRRAWAAAILKNYQYDSNACFVDRASYRSGLKFNAVVINHKGQLANCTGKQCPSPYLRRHHSD
ncbi:hypothetical protein HPB50_009800 [Hyalomma asiaticum]|uniref:Uncharacterized protein n=1 Tax=Hyalomma asiaticum TaxID=266040 RepID=A0ACB7TFM3_HYAAI|nr:hypothetical protein HPB50_009800 [Hyalomma asiaticum]